MLFTFRPTASLCLPSLFLFFHLKEVNTKSPFCFCKFLNLNFKLILVFPAFCLSFKIAPCHLSQSALLCTLSTCFYRFNHYFSHIYHIRSFIRCVIYSFVLHSLSVTSIVSRKWEISYLQPVYFLFNLISSLKSPASKMPPCQSVRTVSVTSIVCIQ
jgi:hypothetical protein